VHEVCSNKVLMLTYCDVLGYNVKLSTHLSFNKTYYLVGISLKNKSYLLSTLLYLSRYV
jgi:hypothetical protein